MKIICDSCGAKYSIADEKVAGKVFKIRCKKCSNMIVVKSGTEAAAPAPVERQATPSIQPTVAAATAMAPAMAPATAPSTDMGAEPIWHVVVGADQQGPYAPAQLGEMLTVGTIDWDAYVWREGLDGWVPARDVPELVEAITGQPYDASYASAGAAPAAAPAAQGGPFGGDFESTVAASQPFADAFSSGLEDDPRFGQPARRMDSEVPTSIANMDQLGGLDGGFGAAPQAGQGPFGGGPFGGGPFGGGALGGEVASRASHSMGGGDLFGQAQELPASPFGGPAPTSMPDQSAMTGQRNENSVLFSLANLQALATESSSSPSRGQALPGHAQGEGSGLIDIRALAAATGRGGGASPAGGLGIMAPATSPKDDRIDDLMSIGTGSPLGMGNLGAPVLAPVGGADSNKKMFMILGGAVVVLLLALIAVVIVFVSKDGDEPVVAANGGAAPIVAGPAVPGAAPTGPAPAAGAAPTPAPGGTTGTSSPTPTAPTTAESSDDTRSGTARRRTGGGSRTGGASTSSPSPAEAAPAPAPAKRTGGGGSIDDLLNQAIGGGGDKPSRESSAREESSGSDDPSLPATPPRDAVLAALRSVEGPVKACGGGQHGMAKTAVVVSGATGRVTNATVIDGPFKGTPIGSCVARVVRGAKFPRFKNASLKVDFPYVL